MKTKTILLSAVIMAGLLGEAAVAGTVSSQIQSANAKSALLSDIQQNLQIFAVGAQKYAFENVGDSPWNETDSTTPVAYAPFLLYAGSASSGTRAASECGFTGGSGTAVAGFSSPVAINGVVTAQPAANNVSWTSPTRFLPSKWNPAFKGTY